MNNFAINDNIITLSLTNLSKPKQIESEILIINMQNTGVVFKIGSYYASANEFKFDFISDKTEEKSNILTVYPLFPSVLFIHLERKITSGQISGFNLELNIPFKTPPTTDFLNITNYVGTMDKLFSDIFNNTTINILLTQKKENNIVELCDNFILHESTQVKILPHTYKSVKHLKKGNIVILKDGEFAIINSIMEHKLEDKKICYILHKNSIANGIPNEDICVNSNSIFNFNSQLINIKNITQAVPIIVENCMMYKIQIRKIKKKVFLNCSEMGIQVGGLLE